ncbi:MAG: hypothetical protein AB2L11_09245 [Syntrophobacteraceae bacterium]
MKHQKVFGIYREQIYSPGKIQDDAAVLDAALAELAAMGFETQSCRGEFIESNMVQPEIVLTMAQSDRVLNILDEWSRLGARVINSVQGVLNCYRYRLTPLLAKADVPVPRGFMVPIDEAEKELTRLLPAKTWLKRGDVHAIREGDVTAVKSAEEISTALDHYRRTGVGEVLAQEHVEGEVVKFYSVGSGHFFRAYSASSEQDVTSSVGSLREIASRAAAAAGLEVYGGDAVLTGKNGAVLIDLNDWPSFSRCYAPAGVSIAQYLASVL